MDNRRERELVLAPNEFAYVLDTTKGHINCYVGPNKTSLAQTDQPVVFNARSKRFEPAELRDAVRLFATAPANWYIALKNPARDGGHPSAGIAGLSPELQVGIKHNVPGPISFALWPGQLAKVIEGHRLQADEYLYVRIYDAAAASEAGWAALGLPADHGADGPALAIGEAHIIKGTETRFYIPPTGVEVVPDREGRHVRKAVRLRRLEYCVLIGEDGRRTYVRGEAMVFPRPDQRFMVRDGQRQFEAIELSETTGLHIKVTAPYTEADGTSRREGEELFITGEGVIYFPREEHAIIRQEGRAVHQAVAIPRGEGRYVLDRRSGAIELRRGPTMLLPDPRKEVVIRRVLTDRECGLLYPGNAEALAFNRRLRGATAPKAAASATPKARRGGRSAYTGEKAEKGADAVERPAFAGPRTITLDTRYDGGVRVEVWAGYAVQVVDRGGDRRVVQGPTSLLLDYDEMLQPLSLSTGTPKSDARPLTTGYLQATGNKVSDRVQVVTRDQVVADLTVTYRVDFEGEADRWFTVANYVKLLCDHAGSMLKARMRQLDIRALQAEVTPVVRDLLLGARPDDGGARPGLRFTENGMRVYDVEVLALEIADEAVRSLLEEAQFDAMQAALAVTAKEAELAHQERLEEVEQALSRARHQTATLQAALAAERSERSHLEAEATSGRKAALARLEAALAGEVQAAELARQAQQREAAAAEHEARMRQRQAEQALELEALAAKVEGAVAAAKAFDPHLVAAVNRLGDQQLLGDLAEHFGELAAVEGRGLLETARRYLDFVPSSLVPQLAGRVEAQPGR